MGATAMAAAVAAIGCGHEPPMSREGEALRWWAG